MVETVVGVLTCEQVQARMYRYVNGTIVTYLGSSNNTQSYVNKSAGTNAGNAVRSEYASKWSSWTSVSITVGNW